MRIKEIHIFQRDLPVQGKTYRMSHAQVDSLDTTIVQIVSDSGLTGWGETCPVGPVYQPHHALGARAALAEIGPGLIGLDPLAIGPMRTAMDNRLDGHGYAKAALDMALWDLAGRHYGVRVCDLIGGARQERVPSYYSISVGEPEECARIAADKVAQGFTSIQAKVGGRPIEADIATLHAVRDAIGPDVQLLADANRGWNARDALFVSSQCADIPLVLEQPCNTFEEVVAVRPRLHHPVYLDESTEDLAAVLRAIAANACDGFGFKLTRAGGISAMRTMCEVCVARSLPHSCNDSWGGDLVAAACVHVAATVPPALMDAVWIAGPYIAEHYDPENGIAIRDGFIDVPRGPGLGIEIDPAMFGTPVASYG